MEAKIQIILYTSGLITIMSLLEGGQGHPKKMTVFAGGMRKNEDWGGGAW